MDVLVTHNPKNFLRRNRMKPKPMIPLAHQLAQMREVWRVNHPNASEQEFNEAMRRIAEELKI